MEENEVMTTEEVIDEEFEDEDENTGSGIGTGLAMLIGSGITLAGIAVGKGAKKLWDKHKAKKAKEKELDEDVVETEVVEDNSKKKSK